MPTPSSTNISTGIKEIKQTKLCRALAWRLVFTFSKILTPPPPHLLSCISITCKLLCILWAVGYANRGSRFLILVPMMEPQQPKVAKGLVACARWRQPLLHRAIILEKGAVGQHGPPDGGRAGGTCIGSPPSLSSSRVLRQYNSSTKSLTSSNQREKTAQWLWHLCPAENCRGQRGAQQAMGDETLGAGAPLIFLLRVSAWTITQVGLHWLEVAKA